MFSTKTPQNALWKPVDDFGAVAKRYFQDSSFHIR